MPLLLLFLGSSVATAPVELYLSAKEPRERLSRLDDLEWVPATGNTKLAGSNSSTVKVFVRAATGRKQTLEGFGGAITDSSAFVYSTLSAEDRAAVVEALYGDSGNRLTLMRVPIGPSDFATSLYSYDENGGAADPDLEHFSVAHDDAYIVPMIRDAMESAARRTDWPQASVDTTSTTTTTPPTTTTTTTMTTDKAREVRVLATPWTAPSWMKRAGLLRNSLKPGLVQDAATFEAYAAYVSAFVDAYAARNVSVWAVTVQNEPHVAGQFLFTYPCNGFDGTDEGSFLGAYLGPTLRAAHPELKIFVHDDQKEQAPGDGFMVDRVNDIIAAAEKASSSSSSSSSFVDGAAFHWYGNNLNNYEALEEVHAQHPELQLLATEATLKYPSLRKWEQAVKYAIDIVGDLNHWSAGWIEWNVLLDGRGGPTCIGPGVDTPHSPADVNTSTTCTWERLRNASFGACDAPIRALGGSAGSAEPGSAERLHFGDQYYMVGHFSRFMPPDSTVLNTSSVIEPSSPSSTTTTTTTTTTPIDRRGV